MLGLERSSSVDLSAAALPMRRAQFAFEYLAGAGDGERLAAQFDAARTLVAGDQVVAVSDEFLGRQPVAVFEDGDGVHRLAPGVVGNTDYRALRDGRVLDARIFHFGGVHV